MQTILEIHGYQDLTDDQTELQELIEKEMSAALNNGDTLGCGEWLASKLQYVDEHQVEEIICRLIALWASPHELKSPPSSIDQLVSRLDEFVPEDLATAVVAASLRIHHSPHQIPPKVKDLAFRLCSHFSSFFDIVPRRQADIINAVIAKLEAAVGGLLATVNSFRNTNCLNAKVASIEIIKKANQLKRMAISGERSILGGIDILLGPSFRKFCENCERHETKDILKRLPDLKEQIQKSIQDPGPYSNSVIWNLTVLPIAKHIEALLDVSAAS
jgi:hypothetical protein